MLRRNEYRDNAAMPRNAAVPPRVAMMLATCLFAAVILSVTTAPTSAQDPNGYTNLQVLPADISREELGELMLENLAGLGLPRRAGEGCLYCHSGSLDVPRGEWDYASDEKPAKERARVMMAMVRDINSEYLAMLGQRTDPTLEVGCYTCHAGRTNPMPLPQLLLGEYRRGGIEALSSAYRSARSRYYEADAYDFRVTVLPGVADRLAELGDLPAAAAVHELNVEYYDDPTAHAGLIQLRLLEALEADGAAAMVDRYRELKRDMSPLGFHPSTLDPLAWRFYRGGRPEEALVLFELNFAEYPAAFTANESLAYAVSDTGDRERGLAIARAWLDAHPEHTAGRQLMAELLRMQGAPPV